MEKVVYAVFAPDTTDSESVTQQLRNDTTPRLIGLGATALHLNLADASVAHVPARRPPTSSQFPIAVVSFWLDNADHREPFEHLLREHGGDIAGYVVSESVPIRNTSNKANDGERTPGVNMIALLEKPEWIDYDEWIHRWRDNHRVVALETQASYAYVRNTVVHSLTPGAPPWAAIVEEGFTAEAAVDKLVWYDANGDPEVLRQRFDRMIASCQTFLDVERGIQLPFAEYVFGDMSP